MAISNQGKGGGKGGNEQVNIKIAATDEASVKIKEVDNSLVGLQSRMRNLSGDILSLSKNVAIATAKITKEIAGIGAASLSTVAATASLAKSMGVVEQAQQAFAALDQQIFSQRAKIGDINAYGGQLARPLIEGILFGASESNTKRIIQQKGQVLAIDLIEAVDLGSVLGQQGAKFGTAGEKIGTAIGQGLEYALKDNLSPKIGNALVSAFQKASNVADVLAPKLKRLAEAVGGARGASSLAAQGLRLEKEQLYFQEKVQERAGNIAEQRLIRGRQGGIEEIEAAQALFRGSEFDRRTALLRTPEFRQSVVRRVGSFAQGLVGGPPEMELRKQEGALQAQKARIEAGTGLRRLLRMDSPDRADQISQINAALERIEGQRKKRSDLQETVASFAEAISESFYDLAFESLGEAFEKNDRVKELVRGLSDKFDRLIKGEGSLQSRLIKEVKFLALDIENAFRNLPSTISKGFEGIKGRAASVLQEVKFLALDIEIAFKNLPANIGKGFQTVKTAISSLLGSVSSALRATGDALKNSISNFPATAGKAVRSLGDTFEIVAGSIAGQAGKISQGIGGAVRNLGAGIQGLDGKIVNLVNRLSPLVGSLAASLSKAFAGISPEISQFILDRAEDFRFMGIEAGEAIRAIGEYVSAMDTRIAASSKAAVIGLAAITSRIGTEIKFAGISVEQSLERVWKRGASVFKRLQMEASFVLLELENTAAVKKAAEAFNRIRTFGTNAFKSIQLEAKFAFLELSNAASLSKARGAIEGVFKGLPASIKKFAQEAGVELGRVGAEVSARVRDKLNLEGTLRQNLLNLAARAGAKEAGTNIGLRLGVAIADGLTAASRTWIGRELNAIDQRVTALARNVPMVMSRISKGLDMGAQGVSVVSGLREPAQIFSIVKEQAGKASNAIFMLSQEISFFASGLQALQAFVVGGPYEILIGQNVRLQEQLLSTRASIAANNKVLQDGIKISDAGEAIKALGPEIESAVADIRKGSLEIVGVTSKDLIEVFGIITEQISNVGLDLKEAGDLTLAFASGLGTIGLPLNQARQEIQSILTGTVDMNSVLAKSLGITNAQLKTWIAQDVVYERLNQRLDAFVQGNALAARTINGITSNLQEIADEIGRQAGAQFMGPIVDSLQTVYEFLAKNQDLMADVVTDRLAELAAGVNKVFVSASKIGVELVPIIQDIIRILWNTVINILNGTATALDQFSIVLAPFAPVLQAIAGLAREAAGPMLQLAISMKVLGGSISLVNGLMGTFIGAIPLLGEALFFIEVRNMQVVNTFAALANPKTGIGAAAASFLLLGRNMNNIPGLAGLVGQRLQGAFGPLAGLVGAAIPTVSTFGLRLLTLGQQIAPLGQMLNGLSRGIPNAISQFTNFLALFSIGGVRLSKFTGPLNDLAGEIAGIVEAQGDLGDVLNKKLNNVLQEQGRIVRNTAIQYGLWGAAVVGLAGSISLLLIRNDALRIVLMGVLKTIWSIVKAIVDGLLSPLGQVVILTGSLVTLIATGAAVQVGRLTVEFAKFAATQAPIVLKLIIDRMRELTVLLQSKTLAEFGGFLGLGSKGKVAAAATGAGAAKAGKTFADFQLETLGGLALLSDDEERIRAENRDSERYRRRRAAERLKGSPLSFGDFALQSLDGLDFLSPEEADLRAREERADMSRRLRESPDFPETFGAFETDDEARRQEQREAERRRREGRTRGMDRASRGPGGKRRGVSAERMELFIELSEAQADAAKSSGKFESGMAGTRKEMTQVAKTTQGTTAATTALGNANLFVSETTDFLGKKLKSLVMVIGPLLGLAALFSAIGYAIIEVNKASEAQKELQKDLLEIYKAQTEALSKINALQNKKIENPLAGKITEADLKTEEEVVAFKEGGGEAVLAVRRAREFNKEGEKKSKVRRAFESAIDATAQAVAEIDKKLSPSDYDTDSAIPGVISAEKIRQNQDALTSTTALRTVEAQRIAGTEVLADAGAYFEEVKNGKRDPKTGQKIEGTSVSGQIRGLILQSKETEKLLAEAKAAGQEARTRELENRLKQEQEAIGAGQDEILNYASALETKDFATDAQKEDAINIAKMLRDVVNQLEGDIEVRGVDFARLGTSFEQLRVEAENALAFFDRGEGNPEQVKQRAGQLLSATQQQLESGLIPAEKALENYAVLFKRNNALELDDQKKLQEAILAARQKQTESSIKLEEAKNARLKQLAAEGRIGRFESELGEMESERRKAEAQLEGLRAGYEEQNALRLAQFKDTESSIQKELKRSRLELAVGRGQISAEDPRAKAMGIGGTRLSAEGEQALLTEISGYQDSLTELGESFRYQQQKANRDFVTEESALLAQLAESVNKETEMRLKELQDRASVAIEQSMAIRKAQLEELRDKGIISSEQQDLAISQLQEDRVEEEIELEKVKLREFLKNPKRFEREIRESNKRIAQLTLERFEAERAEWEKQLALFQRYVNDQAEAAKNAIEIENQELIKQSKLYEAIGQAIEQRNNLLNKSKDFIQSTGSAIADNLERMAKLTGNEVLQADLGTIAAIVRRDTLAQQLEIQAKIFEIEQKQAEIALIRKEAENAIALAKAKQQIISAQGEVVVAREKLERGEITEAEYTSKQIDLMTAALEYKGLEMERSFIAQEREMMPIVQGLQRQQQEQQMEQQLLAADIGVLETMPQGLALDAQGKLLTRIAQDMGVEASNRQEAYQQFRGVRGEVQSDYAQRVYGDAGVFTESEEYRMAQATGGGPNANVRYLQSQGIDLSLYSEMGNLGVTPVASVPVYENAEGVFESGTGLRGSSGAFDPQTERLAEMMTGVEEATAGMDASIEDLSASMEGITLENLQAALPEIVGRDAIIQTTFESAGNVQAAIEEGLGQSNVQLETITEGLEPLADVRDFLGADGPLHQSLEKLDLEPYLGEGTQLLRSTSSIESMVGRIATAVEAEPAAEPGAEATPGAEAPRQRDFTGVSEEEAQQIERGSEVEIERRIPAFVRDFEKLLSADALKAARGWGSEGGWRITESELRNTITQTLTPLLSADSQLQISKSSTEELISLFQQSFGQERLTGGGRGRGSSGETRYEVKPNLTFNINGGNANEKLIAQTAIGEFEKVLDRALATR